MVILSKIRALFGIVDFFIPIDLLTTVLSSVLLVFALENVLDTIIGDASLTVWLIVSISGVAVLAVVRLLSADEDEIDELEDDLDDF